MNVEQQFVIGAACQTVGRQIAARCCVNMFFFFYNISYLHVAVDDINMSCFSNLAVV